MSQIIDIDVFRTLLNRDCARFPHGALLLGDLAYLHRRDPLIAALKDVGTGFDYVHGRISRVNVAVEFMYNQILSDDERELFDSAIHAASGLRLHPFRHFRQIAITCLLMNRTDELKEFADFAYDLDSIDAGSMYTYLDENPGLPYAWWYRLTVPGQREGSG